MAFSGWGTRAQAISPHHSSACALYQSTSMRWEPKFPKIDQDLSQVDEGKKKWKSEISVFTGQLKHNTACLWRWTHLTWLILCQTGFLVANLIARAWNNQLRSVYRWRLDLVRTQYVDPFYLPSRTIGSIVWQGPDWRSQRLIQCYMTRPLAPDERLCPARLPHLRHTNIF